MVFAIERFFLRDYLIKQQFLRYIDKSILVANKIKELY